MNQNSDYAVELQRIQELAVGYDVRRAPEGHLCVFITPPNVIIFQDSTFLSQTLPDYPRFCLYHKDNYFQYADPRMLTKRTLDSFLEQSDDDECPICFEEYGNADQFHCETCGNKVCKECVCSIMDEEMVWSCPQCRANNQLHRHVLPEEKRKRSHARKGKKNKKGTKRRR